MTLFITTLSIFVSLSGSTSLRRLSDAIMADNILPLLGMNGAKNLSMTNSRNQALAMNHILGIEMSRYREVMEALGISVQQFIHEFPPLHMRHQSHHQLIAWRSNIGSTGRNSQLTIVLESEYRRDQALQIHLMDGKIVGCRVEGAAKMCGHEKAEWVATLRTIYNGGDILADVSRNSDDSRFQVFQRKSRGNNTDVV